MSPLIINSIPGDPAANSYESLTEAQGYFDARLSLAGWDNANSQDVLLVMGTRTLDALAQPFKTFFPATGGAAAYYRVRRQWTGKAATPTQRLSWPRVGMFDHNANPLDLPVASVTAGAAALVATTVPHCRATGDVALFFGTACTPSIDGPQTLTVVDATHFTVPITVTIGSASFGQFAVMPQALKDALAELAGQLGTTDRTLDNDVIVQGITSIRAGSVALGFKQAIIPQVIPDAVYNLMPQSWLTDELYIMAQDAVFQVSDDPTRAAREGRIPDYD